MELIIFPCTVRTDKEVEQQLENIFKKLFRYCNPDPAELEMIKREIMKHERREDIIEHLEQLSDLIGQPDTELTQNIIEATSKELFSLDSPIYAIPKMWDPIYNFKMWDE